MGSSLGRWLAEQRENRRAAGDRRALSTVLLLLPGLPRQAPPGKGTGDSPAVPPAVWRDTGAGSWLGFIPRPAW